MRSYREHVTTPAQPAPSDRPDQLRRAVEVMDRLRSPGGCPWDAEQTHRSLARYLVEECYELLQAIEDGDDAAIREELGDVLLQVLFHARIAQERPRDGGGFDVQDVAGDLADKLERRHPHVFGDGEHVRDAADQQDRWDELKKQEGRKSVVDGVALGQPAAALAGKLGSRARKADLDVPLPDGDDIGSVLFRAAYQAGRDGIEPESALRAVAVRYAAELQRHESRSGGNSSGTTGV